MEIKITGLNETLAQFGKYKDQLPYAVSLAINKTAQAVKKAEQAEMVSKFENPTPYIMRSVQTTWASRAELVSTIALVIPGSQVGAHAPTAVRAEVAGGERKIKGAEAHLRAAGILPPDKYLAPARAAQRDNYGNIPGYVWVQILSDCQAFQEQGYHMNRTVRSGLSRQRQYYVRTVRGVNIGIYKRTGSLGSGNRFSTVTDTPVVNFVSKPHYKQRFDFYGVARQTVNDTLKQNMVDAITQAIRTAR